MTAIDGRDNAIDLHLALLGHRYLGDLPDNRSVTFVDSNATTAPLTKRLTPVALLRNGVEHSEEVRPGRQQRATELVRVLSCRLCQLVDIAFDEERILRRADRSPEHDWHMGVLEHTADTHAWNRIGNIGEAFDSLRLDAVLNFIDAGRTQDRANSDLRVECGRQSIL